MKKIVLILPLALALSGCMSSTKPTPAGMAVKVVDSKPRGCESLGNVDTISRNMTKSESLNYIRNETVSVGGDTLRIAAEQSYNYGGGQSGYYSHKAYMYNCGK